jgi:ParB family chromosome partitioning protein
MIFIESFSGLIRIDENHLNDLADSIKQYGILQPIVLRKTVQGYYIVVGERRSKSFK